MRPLRIGEWNDPVRIFVAAHLVTEFVNGMTLDLFGRFTPAPRLVNISVNIVDTVITPVVPMPPLLPAGTATVHLARAVLQWGIDCDQSDRDRDEIKGTGDDYSAENTIPH